MKVRLQHLCLSTSYDRIVEMAGNKGPEKDYTGLTENLEVIASMCWMIVAHIIKNNTTQHVVCKGLFVDKLLGCGILCKVCDIGDSAEADFVLHSNEIIMQQVYSYAHQKQKTQSLTSRVNNIHKNRRLF